MSDPRIGLFFDPKSVAVIGASADLAKASGLPLRNIVNSKFTGKIYPVNLRAAEIGGVKCYPTVTDLPEAPDLAILMIDAKLTAEILEECGRKGVKTAIIGSAGFSEAGPEGQARQDEVSAIAKRYNIRVCGPNCHGTFNVYKNIPCGYDHAFALPIKPGPVAIASHSGALLGVIGHRAVQANQGFSYMVSNGNEMDVDLCDFTEFFLEDDNTRVVAVLMEGLKNGRRFLDLAERAHELGKKIVVLKVGKSERGALTTMAHTARMAGAGEVYEAAFRQYGVIATDTVETFLGSAQLAAHQPVPRARAPGGDDFQRRGRQFDGRQGERVRHRVGRNFRASPSAHSPTAHGDLDQSLRYRRHLPRAGISPGGVRGFCRRPGQRLHAHVHGTAGGAPRIWPAVRRRRGKIWQDRGGDYQPLRNRYA